MNVLISILKIGIRFSIFYFLIIGLYESFYEVSVDRNKKISINISLLLSSIILEFFTPLLGQFADLLYIIPLSIIYKVIFIEPAKYTIVSMIFSFLIFLLSETISYLTIKIFTSLNVFNILILNSILYSFGVTFFSIIFARLSFKYIKNNKEKILIALKKLNVDNIFLVFYIIFSMFMPIILYTYFNHISYDLYVVLVIFLSALMFVIYVKYYINSQSEIVQSQLYTKSLLKIIDNLRILKHDYSNILLSINGYLATQQYEGLKEHVENLTSEINKITQTESVNPSVINQPAVYGIIGAKYFTAVDKNIKFNVDVASNIKEINFNFTDLSRILGILLDNAIEATEQADSKEISIKFTYNKKKQADMIEIKNNINSDVKIDLNKIFDKGESSKKIKSGIGLWEVKNIIASKNNSQIYANVENNTFSQTIVIEKS